MKLLTGEVEQFEPNAPAVILLTFSHEDKEEKIRVKATLNDIVEETHKVLMAIRKHVRTHYDISSDSDDPFENFINVLIDQEDVVEAKLVNFMRNIKNKKTQLTGSKMHGGYLGMVNQGSCIKVKF